jgi:phage-related protein
VAVEKGATATQALAAVQQTFAGQSEAYSNTAAGGIDKLKNAFDDAMETVGSTVLPLVADLATKFSEILPKIMEVVGGIMDFLKPAFELIGTLLNAIGTGLDWLGQQLGLWSDTTKTKTGEASQAWHEHEGVVATAATNIAASGTLAGQGYGQNTVEGVNA